MSGVGAALIGGGFAARSIWAPRLNALPGVEVRALADPSETTQAEWRDELGAGSVYAAHAAIPADNIDVAFILSPNTVHVEQARWFLERGVATVVEKPVCLSLGEVDALQTATEGGAACIPTRVNIYRPDIKRLVELVRGGRCGPVRHVEASWVRASGLPATTGWRTQDMRVGGGVLLDLGWHLADVVFEMLGDEWPAHAAASCSGDFIAAGGQADWIRPGGAAEKGAAGGGEDTVRGFLVNENGVSLALTAAWASHRPLDETCISVFGPAGEITLRTTFGLSPHRAGGSTLTILTSGAEPIVETFETPIGEEYDYFLSDILQRITSRAPPRADDLAVTRRIVRAMELFGRSLERAD